ncbi:MAG: TetR/AcrR family transcriptional regulator [Myxococcota bacterium]
MSHFRTDYDHPMANRRYHHGNLRRALMDAALELVAEKGPDGFTMAAAGRRAGVSSGAPYKHFPDRAALMKALCLEGFENLNAAVAVAAAEAPTAIEGFRRVGIAYVKFAAENPGYFRVMNMPEYAMSASMDGPDQAYWVAVRAALDRLPADQRLDPEDPLWITLAARVLVHGLASMFVSGQLGAIGISADRAEQLADVITFAASLIDQAQREPPQS